jgi:hypothetical protein
MLIACQRTMFSLHLNNTRDIFALSDSPVATGVEIPAPGSRNSLVVFSRFLYNVRKDVKELFRPRRLPQSEDSAEPFHSRIR